MKGNSFADKDSVEVRKYRHRLLHRFEKQFISGVKCNTVHRETSGRIDNSVPN